MLHRKSAKKCFDNQIINKHVKFPLLEKGEEVRGEGQKAGNDKTEG